MSIARPYYVIESNSRVTHYLTHFQNVVLKISFLDLIVDSSCVPFRQRCPCIRCWQYSLVCALLKQGDHAAFIRCAPVRFAYLEGRAFRHGDIVRCPLLQTFRHESNSRCRKTPCPIWPKRPVDLLSALLLGKGGQSLVGWISNVYTLGQRTGVFIVANAHTVI
jgi:hypothetical protein